MTFEKYEIDISVLNTQKNIHRNRMNNMFPKQINQTGHNQSGNGIQNYLVFIFQLKIQVFEIHIPKMLCMIWSILIHLKS